MDAVDGLGALWSPFFHSQLSTVRLLALLIIFERATPEDGAAASLKALQRAYEGHRRCSVLPSRKKRKEGTLQAVKATRRGWSEYC